MEHACVSGQVRDLFSMRVSLTELYRDICRGGNFLNFKTESGIAICGAATEAVPGKIGTVSRNSPKRGQIAKT